MKVRAARAKTNDSALAPGQTWEKSEEVGPAKFTKPEVEPSATFESLQAELKLLEAQQDLIQGLPHLHGWKFYPWARTFFESTNKQNFLCAANQISKSSTQIRKCIDWATDQEKWPSLWMKRPNQFWYLYPSQDVVNIEFELKWKREFLPRGKYETDPVYGWKVLMKRGDVIGIAFNSGVYVFFKTYTKDVQVLQTGTCDAIFCDEELPEKLYDELIMRLNATDGYFHMVFTATLGQELWRRTMEARDDEDEAFPDALKLTVSLYEAMYYEDGTPSHWTEARITSVKNKCKSHTEVLKRVYGRFIMVEGRIYPTFDATRHMKEKHPIPPSWHIFAGVDIGSGGAEGHPSAIVFVAVRPDYRAGRVICGWRGDKIQTTDSDVVLKYIEMKKENKFKMTNAYYDWASKDFETIATRMQESFLKAEKGHDLGEGVVNTLFKNDMLYIYEDGELGKLAGELSTIRSTQRKNHRKDDFADALRYAVSSIPWDFSGVAGIAGELEDTPEEPMNHMQREIAERRKAFEASTKEHQAIEDEFAEANESYGT